MQPTVSCVLLFLSLSLSCWGVQVLPAAQEDPDPSGSSRASVTLERPADADSAASQYDEVLHLLACSWWQPACMSSAIMRTQLTEAVAWPVCTCRCWRRRCLADPGLPCRLCAQQLLVMCWSRPWSLSWRLPVQTGMCVVLYPDPAVRRHNAVCQAERLCACSVGAATLQGVAQGAGQPAEAGAQRPAAADAAAQVTADSSADKGELGDEQQAQQAASTCRTS